MLLDNEFFGIFKSKDTDKSQNYSEGYENIFKNIRKEIKLLFEIGVCRGGSVRGFKEYFPNAIIVGIDIEKNSYFEEDRIKIEIGNATDENFINFLIKKYGFPDIIIDDGSHFSTDIKKTFSFLYDKAKICYIIEDYGTQFFDFRNGFYINDEKPATDIIHNKIDQLLKEKNTCKSIHIYYSICFIMK